MPVCFWRWAIITNTLLLYLTTAGILFYGCSEPLTREDLGARHGRQAPRIEKYGAVDRLKVGQTWRVFMAGEDPDGDMDAVIFEMYQPGRGWYPPHIKKLKKEAWKSFAGYFFLNTPAFWPHMWGLQLSLKFKIRDKAGHTSQMITLPLRFVGKQVDQPVSEGFGNEDVRSLGPIMIKLVREDHGKGYRKSIPNHYHSK